VCNKQRLRTTTLITFLFSLVIFSLLSYLLSLVITHENLRLTLKPPVFGKTAEGLPFLGFLIKDNGIYLLQKSKRRVTGRISEITASLSQNMISEEKAAERARSVLAAISLARTNRLRKILCEKGERFLAPTG